jgi:aspartyl-tRNA(Asn)/glutamyl-tRNA(Gln) amidotransferase subunit C
LGGETIPTSGPACACDILAGMSKQELTGEQVAHVAKLARLALPAERLAKFSSQLSAILGHIEKMAEVDVSGVEPMAQPMAVSNVMRDDSVKEPLPLEKVLQNAPATDGAFFRVPKVIGGEEDSAG